jgi:HSP20 family protein
LLASRADVFSRFDRLFEEWARMMPFRPMSFPRWPEAGDLIRVEEYREDGTLVVRADLPGIDPDKDVELTVAGGMLHIEAERREEEKREEKGYLRREVRYGAFSPVAATAGGRDRGRHHRVLQGRGPGDPHPGAETRRGQEDRHQQILTERPRWPALFATTRRGAGQRGDQQAHGQPADQMGNPLNDADRSTDKGGAQKTTKPVPGTVAPARSDKRESIHFRAPECH